MKTFFISCFLLLFAVNVFSQDQPIQVQTQKPVSTQSPSRNLISSGFYLKIGGSIPMGEFAKDHINLYNYKGSVDTIKFNQAKFGSLMELGFLIYLGPAFANNHLRAGIDATFLAVSFNPTSQTLPENSSASKKLEYWYYFAGQKFGPLITINPVDYLMIDLSYKLNATAAWYHSMWGSSYTVNEVSLQLRYRLMLFQFQYNWGKVKFTYNQDNNPTYMVDNSTFRLVVGLKF